MHGNQHAVSRRAAKLVSVARARLPSGPLQVLIVSTGLKVHGAGEWLADKRGQRSRRKWRKLHLAVDADGREVVCVTLTDQDVDLPSEMAAPLEPIEAPTDQIAADRTRATRPTDDRRAATPSRW